MPEPTRSRDPARDSPAYAGVTGVTVTGAAERPPSEPPERPPPLCIAYEGQDKIGHQFYSLRPAPVKGLGFRVWGLGFRG